MRISTIIIDFVKHSYVMLICAFLAGVLLFIEKKKISVFGKIIEENVSEKRVFYWILLSVTIVFILWGYVFKSAFYTPYNTGVQGDNFQYLSAVIQSPHYYSPRHIIFPWIGGEFILLAKKMGFLNPQSHLFRFRALNVASLPVHIFSIVGLIYLFRLFKLLQFSFTKRIVGVLFLATTFGYWLWSIQPNSIGTALALQCVVLYYSIKLIMCKNRALFFLAPFSIVLVLYAHISSVSFIVTLALFLGVYIVIDNYKNMRGSFIHIVSYIATLLFAGIIFLHISAGYFNIRPSNLANIREYAGRLIAAQHYGFFEVPGIRGLFKGLINNIGQTLLNLFGFWAPQDAFDYVLIFVILAITCALFIYIVMNFKRVYIAGSLQTRSVILMFLSVIITPFIFFMVKTFTMHYYVIALVPNAVLFLILIFKTDRFHKSGFGTFLLCCLIPVAFLFNGFSSMNVLKGLDYRQSSCYKKFDVLYRRYPKEKVYFFETYNKYDGSFRQISGRKVYFFEDAMTTDYAMGGFLGCFNPSFPNIEWIYHFDIQSILDKLNKNDGLVIIGSFAYAEIKHQVPIEMGVFSFKDNETNEAFYILGKKNKGLK